MGNDLSNATTVTIRVHRFTPREAKERKTISSPFARSSSPFASTGSKSNRKIRGKQWVEEYTVAARPEDTVLDCLLSIKQNTDPTLAFRYSCGHGMCGSDAVSINGTPTLLCTATVGLWAKPQYGIAIHSPKTNDEGFRSTKPKNTATDTEQSTYGITSVTNHITATTNNISSDVSNSATLLTQAITAPADHTENSNRNSSSQPAEHLGIIELAPLPGFPVQRDLIADIDLMLKQIKKLQPYLQADGVLATTQEGKVDVFEYLQHPEQLAQYELLSNCIACGVCEGACPVYAGGEAFIGPAALVHASRFINDSRDTAADARLDAIDTADGVAACQSVRACSRECPRGIDVGEEMWQLIAKVKER